MFLTSPISDSPSILTRAEISAPTVVLLGAGQPYKGQIHSSLTVTPDSRRVLEWVLDAFAELSPKYHFVGGYQLNEVARQYPQMTYSVNPNWETTGSVASLFTTPLTGDTIT